MVGVTSDYTNELCTGACTIDLCKIFCSHVVMKAEVRILIKDYHRNKNLEVLLVRPPYPSRGLMVWMNRERWPEERRPSVVRFVGSPNLLSHVHCDHERSPGSGGIPPAGSRRSALQCWVGPQYLALRTLHSALPLSAIGHHLSHNI